MTRKNRRSHSPSGKTSRRKGQSKPKITLLLILLASAFYYLVPKFGPCAIGVWQDDGIYVSTAKSLAMGSGYRHIELPTRPLQTKYPIFYPALLSIVFFVSPAYPQNSHPLLLPTVIAAGVLVILAAVYTRRLFSDTSGRVVLAGILAFFSPVIISLVRFTLSDLLYGALSVGALLALDDRCVEAATQRERHFWVAVSAFLVSLCVLTRAFGLTLLVGALLTFLLRKQYREAGMMIVVFGLCLMPWWFWQMTAAHANGTLQHSALEAPELSYSLWLPQHPGQTARVVLQNLFRTVFGFGYFQLALPQQFCIQSTANLSWRTFFLHLACYGSAILMLVGFLKSARTRWGVFHLYAVFYAALMLVWPFEPYRFLVPWTPFLIHFVLSGAHALASDIGRRVAFLKHPAVAEGFVRTLFSLLMVLFLVEDFRIVGSTIDHIYLREIEVNCSEIADLERWLVAKTSPDEVIASDRPAGLFLMTGRQGQYFWPDTDPYAAYYGEDRKWWKFYFWPGEQDIQSIYEQMQRSLEKTYRDGRIAYYVEHVSANIPSVAMARIMAAHPAWFDLRYVSPMGTYKVYRVHLESRQRPG